MNKNQDFEKIYRQYFERFAYYPQALIESHPQENTGLIVVIPCYNEAYLLTTFQSLIENYPTTHPVEVIAVINQSETVDITIQNRNEQTFQDAQNWVLQNKSDKFSFKILYEKQLPKKHAGVGLARKIGMDEALRRFQTINLDGGIVCLDADCQVEKNYLQTLEDTFQNPKLKILSIYFEHQLDQDEELNQGIIFYELFLRYYVQALKFTKFPNSFHTVGSSMAVRASTYALGGGMNRRKAGEDFYFMHKMALMEGHQSLTKTCVYPSARISERVPFGTGKAQQKWLEQTSEFFLTYDFQIFIILKNFISLLPKFYEQPENSYLLIPIEIQSFITKDDFTQKLSEIQKQTKEYKTFHKRFFTWWDGLKMLQCVHFLRDNHFPNQNIMDATATLVLNTSKLQLKPQVCPDDMLAVFRELDKNE